MGPLPVLLRDEPGDHLESGRRRVGDIGHPEGGGRCPIGVELDVDRLDSIERMRLKVALETVAMLRTLLEQRLRLETVR